MASSFNLRAVHRDGRAELTIGVDENSKTIDGIGNRVVIKNSDGSAAEISKENIPCIPDDASEENKLVTQKDLKNMMENIQDILNAANNLAKIVGGI